MFNGRWQTKSGYAHWINENELTWKAGGKDQMNIFDDNKFSILVKGERYTATMSDNYMILKWSDGDQWARISPFDGDWGRSDLRATIRGNILTFGSGTPYYIVAEDDGTGFEVELSSGVFVAELLPDGQSLQWNDGDIWQLNPPAATAKAKAAPKPKAKSSAKTDPILKCTKCNKMCGRRHTLKLAAAAEMVKHQVTQTAVGATAGATAGSGFAGIGAVPLGLAGYFGGLIYGSITAYAVGEKCPECGCHFGQHQAQ